jgi:hypothetical protein
MSQMGQRRERTFSARWRALSWEMPAAPVILPIPPPQPEVTRRYYFPDGLSTIAVKLERHATRLTPVGALEEDADIHTGPRVI